MTMDQISIYICNSHNIFVINYIQVIERLKDANITNFFHPPPRLDVMTLTLGSWPKQRFAKVHAKNETKESHFMLPGV
jgi:hypothetical protein